MMRSLSKKATFESAFDRKYAIGYWRVSKEIKVRNNRTFRRQMKKEIKNGI